jgi:hypothetical protein
MSSMDNDITETNYFDKPPDNVVLKYLPRAMMVLLVMVAAGVWYANLILTQSPKSNASEMYHPPIQLPTSSLHTSLTPSPTIIQK